MEWISVKERLPSHEQRCLYCVINHIPGPITSGKTIILGYFSGDQFYDLVDGWPNDIDDVTHWMSIPKLPKD